MMDRAEKNRYAAYLLAGERLVGSYDIGLFSSKLYTVGVTTQRIIVLKKFPRNVIEIDLPEVELIEYYTNVAWLRGFYALILLAITALFFLNSGIVLSRLNAFLPPLAPILNAPAPGRITWGALLLAAGLTATTLYQAGLFVLSLLGKLRILIRGQPPLAMVTPLTPAVQACMKQVEMQRRQKRKTRG